MFFGITLIKALCQSRQCPDAARKSFFLKHIVQYLIKPTEKGNFLPKWLQRKKKLQWELWHRFRRVVFDTTEAGNRGHILLCWHCWAQVQKLPQWCYSWSRFPRWRCQGWWTTSGWVVRRTSGCLKGSECWCQAAPVYSTRWKTKDALVIVQLNLKNVSEFWCNCASSVASLVKTAMNKYMYKIHPLVPELRV